MRLLGQFQTFLVFLRKEFTRTKKAQKVQKAHKRK